jgi:hypothetical protein
MTFARLRQRLSSSIRQARHGPIQQAHSDPGGVVRCERAALQRRGFRERGVDPLRARTEAAWVAGSRGRHPSCELG